MLAHVYKQCKSQFRSDKATISVVEPPFKRGRGCLLQKYEKTLTLPGVGVFYALEHTHHYHLSILFFFSSLSNHCSHSCWCTSTFGGKGWMPRGMGRLWKERR